MPVIGPPQTANPWADPSMKPASVIQNPDLVRGYFSHRQSLQRGLTEIWLSFLRAETRCPKWVNGRDREPARERPPCPRKPTTGLWKGRKRTLSSHSFRNTARVGPT